MIDSEILYKTGLIITAISIAGFTILFIKLKIYKKKLEHILIQEYGKRR